MIRLTILEVNGGNFVVVTVVGSVGVALIIMLTGNASSLWT